MHKPGADFESEPWALYHLDQDFSECRDLAQTHPEKLKQLVDLWWAEAKGGNALPLDDKWAARSNVNRGVAARRFYRFFPGLERIDRIMAPDIARRSYSISADVEIPAAGAQGVLLAFGGALAGYVLYVKDGRLTYEYVFSGHQKHVVHADRPLTPGRHVLALRIHRCSRTMAAVAHSSSTILPSDPSPS